jgi:hypothetical protein
MDCVIGASTESFASDTWNATLVIIREEVLDAEITALLKPFILRADWADEMIQRVKMEKQQSAQSNALVAEQKRAEIEKINFRLQKLLDSFLDGMIERDDYTAEKTKLMSRKKSLQEALNRPSQLARTVPKLDFNR